MVQTVRENAPSAIERKQVSTEDPRYLRVRSRLTRTILDLAGQKPAEKITVSELTQQAGISRTTFYKHGKSPASFLAEYFIEQLQPIMERLALLFSEGSPNYLMQWRDLQLDLLAHVKQNCGIYKYVFGAERSVVLSILTSYFEDVFDRYVRGFAGHVDEGAPSELWISMATAQQVQNTIAMVSAWLRTDMRASPEEVVATYMSLVPQWQLTGPSETGEIQLPAGKERARTIGPSPYPEAPRHARAYLGVEIPLRHAKATAPKAHEQRP